MYVCVWGNHYEPEGGPLIVYLMKLVGRKGALSFSGGLL